MAVTNWQSTVKNKTLTTYKAALVTARDAAMSAVGDTANATTTTQTNAAESAADLLLAALGITGSMTNFDVVATGWESGTGAAISVTVTKR